MIPLVIFLMWLGQPFQSFSFIARQPDHKFVLNVMGDLEVDAAMLHISCSDCSTPIIYTEDVSGSLIGIQQIPEAPELLLLTWDGGNGIRVEVFKLGADGIRQVLVTGGTSSPHIATTSNNRLMVQTEDQRWVQNPVRRIPFTTTWVWDGERFTSRQEERRAP